MDPTARKGSKLLGLLLQALDSPLGSARGGISEEAAGCTKDLLA